MRTRELAALTIAVALVGCYDGAHGSGAADDGSSGAAVSSGAASTAGSSDDGPGALDCETPQPGASPIRRLTRRELDNTLTDLLGPAAALAASSLPTDVQTRIYDTDIASHGITEELAYAYLRLGEAVSTAVSTDVDALVGCDPTSGEACARSYVTELCPRAWRRPCSATEIDGLVALWASGDDFADGVRRVIELMLQSADFLYRPELGDVAAELDGVVPLDSWEIATRLSYLLWGSMPDDALFDAARADTLRDVDGIAAQVDRMLDDPRAARQIVWFHEQWLGLVAIESVAKDPALFPEFAALRASMREEAARFVEAVVLGGGDLGELLSSPSTWVDDELAGFYGLPLPGSGEDFVEVELPADRHAGLLTKGAFLAIGGNQVSSSPVRRGVAVIRQVLCSTPPPPPPDVMGSIPPPSPGTTTRERFESHVSDPACSGCHGLFDPLGFAFEHFDAAGRWRDLDNGFAVDASGVLVGTDVDGSFDGAAELAARLSESSQVQQCYVDHLLGFAGGRLVDDEDDACAQKNLRSELAAGSSLVELLAALARSDGFRYRRSEP
jgi:Protein of unknown function (DUF1592)/Protein of unknown function (DUF1588)/Protein of unknown function (DUF1595)/Protein of unknown function (DUF1585)/Protein of unknown function (DUF1587)